MAKPKQTKLSTEQIEVLGELTGLRNSIVIAQALLAEANIDHTTMTNVMPMIELMSAFLFKSRETAEQNLEEDLRMLDEDEKGNSRPKMKVILD